ncbi:MAG: hypothetical protein H0Z24_01155 [Thermosipho sp. (in: Bacteria)]|nr:hypothetical protein [Thermosipho sp. (in: thermotogales)]
MKIEREKKYLIPDYLSEKLKLESLLNVGVIQWYINDLDFIIDNRIKVPKYRLRLVIDKDFNKKWVIAFKGKLRGFEREEYEFEIEEKKINVDLLKEYKLTMKLRYYLTYPGMDPEIVLDEFLSIGEPVKVKYLAEIETFNDFEEIEQKYGFKEFEVSDFKKYTNEQLARKIDLETNKLINFLYEKLIKSR